MPNGNTLAKMYGIDYHLNYDEEVAALDSRQPQRAIACLKKLDDAGVFADYGCGNGSLLNLAENIGWKAFGIEFSPEVAATAENSTGVRVYSAEDPTEGVQADVLHLGDVLEHLTDLDNQIPEILRWLKPGGLLIAQGPLEAHRNLFTFAVKNLRRLKGVPEATMPPYHVILATSKGQRTLFTRFGFEEKEYSVYEANFPVRPQLDRSVLSSPRMTALYVLRKLSQATSAVLPGEWGNRYFYCGRWNGSTIGVPPTH